MVLPNLIVGRLVVLLQVECLLRGSDVDVGGGVGRFLFALAFEVLDVALNGLVLGFFRGVLLDRSQILLDFFEPQESRLRFLNHLDFHSTPQAPQFGQL